MRINTVLGLGLGFAIAAAWSTSAFAATTQFHGAISADNPILWYQFSETSGAAVNYGSLGASYNATGSGTQGVATSSGDTGISVGAGQFFESGDVSPLTGNPTFTIEALAFVASVPGSGNDFASYLFWGGNTSGASALMGPRKFNNEAYGFTGFWGSGVLDDPSNNPTVNLAGDWHHVVWVRTGGGDSITGNALYIDGANIPLVPDPIAGSPVAVNLSASTFLINSTGGLQSFNGIIDEVALYDVALTSEQVLAHYNSISAIPVPAAIWLFCSGLIGLVGIARRKKF